MLFRNYNHSVIDNYMGDMMVVIWEYCADAETISEAHKEGRQLLKEGFKDYRIRKDGYGWYLVDGLKE